jgi:hypothetical protein
MNCLRNYYLAIGMLSSQLLLAPGHAQDLEGLKQCGSDHGAQLSKETFHEPPMNVEMEVEIGQTMVSTFNRLVMDGVVRHRFAFDKGVQFFGKALGQNFEVNVAPSAFVIHDKDLTYNPPEYTFKYGNDASPRTGWSKPALLFTMNPRSGEVIARLGIGFGAKVVIETMPAEKSASCFMYGIDSFRRELVYSGVSQGTITILYREFSNDTARPAFSQELRYDLKEGNEIGYNGARFNVIKANNISIKYKVIKHLQ